MLTADLLPEICHDVEIEPTLQPLTGERLSNRTANTEDGARLDVKACDMGFGTGCNVHFSTLGFSTPTHKVTVQLNHPQHTPNTSQRKDAFMAKESET